MKQSYYFVSLENISDDMIFMSYTGTVCQLSSHQKNILISCIYHRRKIMALFKVKEKSHSL